MNEFEKRLLADDNNSEEHTTLETFDNGKPLDISRMRDLPGCLQILRYYNSCNYIEDKWTVSHSYLA